MSENITIHLFGKSYSFRADEGVSDAKAVAHFLETEVNSVEKAESRSLRQNDFTKLTQAALNIANGFIELQRKHLDLLDRVTKRTDSLKRTLDAACEI